jgi:proteic killer suppression protein
VIKSFKCTDTEALFKRRSCPRFQSIAKAALKKLLMLDAARVLGDLSAVPGNKLERLKGNRTGQHSIRINDQWRICFVWDGNAYQVEIVDYH